MTIRPVIHADELKDDVEQYAKDNSISHPEAWERLVHIGLEQEATEDEDE